jgi:hypothetical protein
MSVVGRDGEATVSRAGRSGAERDARGACACRRPAGLTKWSVFPSIARSVYGTAQAALAVRERVVVGIRRPLGALD